MTGGEYLATLASATLGALGVLAIIILLWSFAP